MSNSKLTPAFKTEFEAAMKWCKGSSPMGRFNDCITVAEKHNLLYELVLHPKFFPLS